MAGRKWKGDVIKVNNPRFVEGSKEHELYKERQKKYYKDTIDLQRERARSNVAKRRNRNQQFVINHLQDKKCERCGVDDIRVLAFDHLEGFNKFANIADIISKGLALSKLQIEIKKCGVLCHNCHMIKTFEQHGGTYKSTMKPCTQEEFDKLYGEFLQ